jgi:CYTH domain-containing protein
LPLDAINLDAEELGVQAEMEKKFLPSPLYPLPPLSNGLDMQQFYLSSDQAHLQGNCLVYGKSYPIIELDEQDLRTVHTFLAWPKPPKLRIRLTEDRGGRCHAYLTIKVDQRAGLGEPAPEYSDLIKNLEFEREISYKIAEKMYYRLGSLIKRVVAKTRYYIGHTIGGNGTARRPFEKPFEIDVFKGPKDFTSDARKIADNSGLVIIELELQQGEIPLPELYPPWVGLDVTGDRRFTNSKLSRAPFGKWTDKERKRILSGRLLQD